MTITEIITALIIVSRKPGTELTLHRGADELLISRCENEYGITLPDDFKTFYRFSDGFETIEDIFNMIPLAEIIKNKKSKKNDTFYIAEYMVYSDMWELEINPDDSNDYTIIGYSNDNKLALTKSLAEFIERFLKGGVFDSGGLYDWHIEVEAQPIYTTKLKTVEKLLTLYYYGLKYGIVSKKEIIEWADGIVMHENDPEYFFIELSLSHDDSELLSLLYSVYVPDNKMVARAVLGLLYHRLSSGVITADKVIIVLDKPEFFDQLTKVEQKQIFNFTDKIWKDEPIMENEELKQNLLSLLVNYKEFEITNYEYWHGINYRIEHLFSPEKNITDVAHQTFKNRVKTFLRTRDAIAYALAFVSLIVVLTAYYKIADKTRLDNFILDTYQLLGLYLFFAFYHVLKAGKRLVKKLIAHFRKLA
jgi:hypothetical protein